MKRFTTVALALTTALAAIIVAGTSEAAFQTSFMNDAAAGSLAEIQLGNLALERSQNEQVRAFAQRMVADHTAANEELTALASSKSMTLPTAPDAKHQNALAKLGTLSGADFDKAFAKQMVSDHEAAVKLFRRESERGSDAASKAFAAKTLPILQGHLDMARSLRDAVRNAGKSTGGSNPSNPNRSDDNRSNGNMSNGNMSDGNMSNGNRSNRNRRTDTDRNDNSNGNASPAMPANTNGNL